MFKSNLILPYGLEQPRVPIEITFLIYSADILVRYTQSTISSFKSKFLGFNLSKKSDSKSSFKALNPVQETSFSTIKEITNEYQTPNSNEIKQIPQNKQKQNELTKK